MFPATPALKHKPYQWCDICETQSPGGQYQGGKGLSSLKQNTLWKNILNHSKEKGCTVNLLSIYELWLRFKDTEVPTILVLNVVQCSHV